MALGALPWSYRRGASPLHRLPAGFKLAFLLGLSLAAFFPASPAHSLVILCGIALLLVALSFAAGSGPRLLLRGSGPLFVVVLAVFVVQGIQTSPLGFSFNRLGESLLFCGRLGAAFASGSLLFAVTTPGQLRTSLCRLEKRLHMERLKPGAAIALMLRFLPRFFEVWEALNLAWKSRGGGNGFARFAVLVPLAVEKMMLKAAETAEALEARGGDL